MQKEQLYAELKRIIQEETEKFSVAVADRCMELMEEYIAPPPAFMMEEEEEPPCTMPVLDSVDDIISAMSGNFEKLRQEMQNKNKS